MRTPISRVRSDTPYAITPYVPSAASNSARNEKPESSSIVNRSLTLALSSTSSIVCTSNIGTDLSSELTMRRTRGHERRRRSIVVNDDARHARRRLWCRQKNLRSRRLAERRVVHVAHDADDGDRAASRRRA